MSILKGADDSRRDPALTEVNDYQNDLVLTEVSRDFLENGYTIRHTSDNWGGLIYHLYKFDQWVSASPVYDKVESDSLALMMGRT